MRLLYVASNPLQSDDLAREKEITELQRRSASSDGDALETIFLPRCKIGELPYDIDRYKPDILHISGHGDERQLELANSQGNPVGVSAGMLKSWLGQHSGVRLVYLNACNSQSIASELTSVVPMAIGTTAPITNSTARLAAALFYGRLARGHTVEEAFDASRAMIEAEQDSAASSRLFTRQSLDASRERLHLAPKIMARFVEHRCNVDDQGRYSFLVGLSGCLRDTSLVVFFTSSEDFIRSDQSVEESLCWVFRGTPDNGEAWIREKFWYDRDFQLVACGMRSNGHAYSVDSKLKQALSEY